MKTLTNVDAWTFTIDTANAIHYADAHGWQRKEITEVFRILRGKGIRPTVEAVRLVDRIAGVSGLDRIDSARKADPQ